MTAAHAFHDDKRLWTAAAVGALALHGAALAAVLLVRAEDAPPLPEPVMEVEMQPHGPAEEATSASADPAPPAPEMQPVAQELPTYLAPEIDIPEVQAPLPPDPVRLPPPVKVQTAAPAPRIAQVPTPQPAAKPAAVSQGAGDAPGDDPRAKKKAADYYRLLMAHLQRKKKYPSEAKKAGQQGVVTVRFTIDRSGNVTTSAIKNSSGHDLLDTATLDLMQRVSPLPPIPKEMGRESLTIALPIDYALSRK
ncbi:energy transducer TonB family protein [Croceicoccus gelatinilyticus]|uniref:energy transducer TonB family protein n=1 Tax=Croceicoccus gelatinilyticus TaxID=2835536 RepID=UPI001BCADEB2|nr:energy transducer TonB [Croceicoccus gelatinilyticus]